MMLDRIPTPGQEGRVLVTPEDGNAPFYAKIQMADNPTQEGTPLSKATLLKDATAEMFGLGAYAVPDDALKKLGDLYLYVWRRTATESHYETKNLAEVAVTLCTSLNNGVVTYADAINFDETTGSIALLSPQTATVSYAGPTDSGIAFLRGKYLKSGSKIYYASESANYYCDRYASPAPYGIFASEVMVVQVSESDIDYVFSLERNAYPDSGSDSYYDYQYLGIPFDNAVTAQKSATGSYTGTGTYGSSNKCSLTFDKLPSLLMISDTVMHAVAVIPVFSGAYSISVHGSHFTATWSVTVSDTTISWYVTAQRNYSGGDTTISATTQSNQSGKTYKYVAFC